ESPVEVLAEEVAGQVLDERQIERFGVVQRGLQAPDGVGRRRRDFGSVRLRLAGRHDAYRRSGTGRADAPGSVSAGYRGNFNLWGCSGRDWWCGWGGAWHADAWRADAVCRRQGLHDARPVTTIRSPAAGPTACRNAPPPPARLRRDPICSSVAQRQSIRLLTGGLLVRIQPEEPISCFRTSREQIERLIVGR